MHQNNQSGRKIAKFVTGNDVTFQGKKYKKVEFEVLNVNNNTQRVEISFISPPELKDKGNDLFDF